ncbi:MAG: transcriptional regulator [Hyphomicrobium sp.]|nr:transcriptional regulator [Hyphomicrobium sp.]PPC82947.1 MAG: transcriptional regulator [Hyphomicrobium sp.]
MPIIHHPDDATLMSFAAGSLGEALSAVIASHIDLCPRCAAEVRIMEHVGAALFDSLKPTGMSGLTVASPLRREVSVRTEPAETEVVGGIVPGPLTRFVGPDLDQIPWKRLGIGVWHYPLPLSPGVKGDLRLLKVAPGQAMPEHGHGGAELTLLLRGSYRDEVGTFRRGDVADLDEDVEHRPVASLDEGCICLIASEEKARFRGLMARLVQPLTGF